MPAEKGLVTPDEMIKKGASETKEEARILQNHIREPFLNLSSGIYALETPPKKWIRPKTLKQIILESSDPKLSVYKKLLAMWPSLQENRLREIIQHVSADRLERVLKLCELLGRSPEFFEEFLARDLTTQQHQVLDALLAFYTRLLPQYEDTIKRLRSEDAKDYPIEIDGKLYKCKVWFLVDGNVIPIDFYARGYKRVLGLPKNIPTML